MAKSTKNNFNISASTFVPNSSKNTLGVSNIWVSKTTQNIKKKLKHCVSYKEPTFGNKMCVQISKVDFIKYVEEIFKLKD